MTPAKYPRRTIALGPPFDDGTYFTPDGKPARLSEIGALLDVETGPEFVARTVNDNRVRVQGYRERMDQLDSKGHRIGWRAFNGGQRR